MQALKEAILQRGKVLPGDIVKVDGFLNHRVDVELIEAIADEFAARFAAAQPDLVLTIEASGIAIAYAVAKRMKLPMVFAKKGEARNIGKDVYAADITSYTRGLTYGAFVSKAHLHAGDRVLIVDDFLANGQAALGLAAICEQAGAPVVGVGIAIEKSWQRGGELLRGKGLDVHSAAIIASLEDGNIRFAE